MADGLVELAARLAREAGAVLLDYAGRGKLDVETKSSDTDPVSEADLASERLITEGLLEVRPDDGILGEEEAEPARRGTTGLRWVVDPLDGTVNFLYGIPGWCVSVCCEDDDGGMVGVIHDPNRDETFTAARGKGAELNGEPIRVNDVDDLSMALIATGFAYGPEVRRVQGQWASDLLGRARDLRRVGAAALDLAWTAAGRFDGFYEVGLNPWDYAAGFVLVQEAGGVTSRRKVTAGPERDDCVFAGGRYVHDQLVIWLGAQEGTNVDPPP